MAEPHGGPAVIAAAVVVAASIACRPAPGLGTLTYRRGNVVHAVDLATCRDRASGRPQPAGRGDRVTSPNGVFRASVHHDTIVVTNVRKHRSFDLLRPRSAVELFGWSPDSRWILYALDPTASIAADGLTLRAIAIDAGGPATIASGLLYDDYRTWCGGRFVMTAGRDRIATRNKRLVAARPGPWRAQPLVRAPARAWGSLACAPDGGSVVAQSQRASDDADFFHTHWALWQVGFDGTTRRLTSPPPGCADESPTAAGDAVFFVRSRRGVGEVYAVRAGKLLGPFASLGYSLGYYGHQAWPYTVSVRR